MLQISMAKYYRINQVRAMDEESTSVSIIPDSAVTFSMRLILSTCVNAIEISRSFADLGQRRNMTNLINNENRS